METKARKPVWPWLGVVVGGVLSAWSVYIAVLRSSPWWYSPFVLGSYTLFSSLNYLLDGRSSARALFDAPVLWLKLYIWLAVVSFIIDFPFGRKIGQFWYYPAFNLPNIIVHVWLIGYPFALLSAAEMYWLLSRLFKSHSRTPLAAKPREYGRIATFLVSFTGALLAAVIFIRMTSGIEVTRKVLILALIATTLGLDSLAAILKKPSFLRATASGNWRPVLGVLIISPLVALVHEYPNTFAHEWVYQNIPFIRTEILGINALVLTLGWLFLVVVGITVAHILAPERMPHSLGGND